VSSPANMPKRWPEHPFRPPQVMHGPFLPPAEKPAVEQPVASPPVDQPYRRPCRKRGFKSEAAANEVLGLLWQKRRRSRIETRAYRCDLHKKARWHLTSQPRREPPTTEGNAT
jgi:hypothetical protein